MRHADARAGLNELTEDFKRPLHLAQDAAGHHIQIAGFQNVIHQNGKFIAAQPASRVLRAQRSAQSISNRNQQNIARRVAQRVVDLLEAVHIEKKHAAALIPPPRPA